MLYCICRHADDVLHVYTRSQSSPLASFLTSLHCDLHPMLTLGITDATSIAFQQHADVGALVRPMVVHRARDVLAGKVQQR